MNEELFEILWLQTTSAARRACRRVLLVVCNESAIRVDELDILSNVPHIDFTENKTRNK